MAGDTRLPSGQLRRTAFLLLVPGLLLRMVHAATFRDSPFLQHLTLDPRLYADWGQAIADGAWVGQRPFFQDPLYAYALAIAELLFGDGPTAAVWIQSALGACVGPLLYLAARPRFGQAAAVVAGLLAALYAPSIYYEGLVVKAGPAMFVVACSLLLTSHVWDRTDLRSWLPVGLLLTAGGLLRGNLLLLVPVLALLLLIERRRLAVGPTLGLIAGFLIVLAPVTLHNRIAGGEWVLTTSNAGQNFYLGNHAGNTTGEYERLPFVSPNPKHEERDFAAEARRRTGREMSAGEVSSFWFAQTFDEIGADPAGWSAQLFRKLRVFLSAYEVPDNLDYYLVRESAPVLRWPLPGFGLLAPLGLLGAGLAWRRRGWPRSWILLGAVYLLTVVAFFVFSRFRMPLAPLFCVFAGHAVIELYRVIRQSLSTRSISRGLLLPLVAVVLIAAFVHLPARGREDDLRVRLARAVGLPHRVETSATARFNLGVIYAAEAGLADDPRPLLELAESRLREARRDDPEHLLIALELGKVLARLERNDEAIEVYTELVQREPANPRHHFGLGVLLRRQSRLEEAAASFRRALRIQPSSNASAVQLGEVLTELGRYDEARDWFGQVLRRSPDHVRARKGWSYVESLQAVR